MYLSPFGLLLLSQITGAVSTSIQYYPRYAPSEAYLDPRDVDDELWGREAEAIADADADADPHANFYTEDGDDIGLRARNIADLYEREIDQVYARMEPFLYDQFLKPEKKSPAESPKSGGSGSGKGGGRSGNEKGQKEGRKGKSKGLIKEGDAEGSGSGSQINADDVDGSDTESGIGTSTRGGSRSRAQSQSGSYRGQGSSYGGQVGSYKGQRESPKSKGSTGPSSPNKKWKGQRTQQEADSQIEMTDRKSQ